MKYYQKSISILKLQEETMKTLLIISICISSLFFFTIDAYSWSKTDEHKYGLFLIDMDDPHAPLYDVA